MNHFRRALVSSVAAMLAGSLHAQDLLAVTWNGAVLKINSYTGATSYVGNGMQGQNSLARATNGTFWSTRRLGAGLFDFTRIDPATGAATVMFAAPDIRGLSTGPGTTLWGVKDQATSDVLVSINTTNGLVTTIGNLGTPNVQGLALHQGVLYAWDTNAGLMVVNTTTGLATDPFPGVSGPIFLQSLCSHPDGRLLVGGGNSSGIDSIYSVDVSTGGTTLIGAIGAPGIDDIRGIEPLAGSITDFGVGCNGAGGPVVHTITGVNQIGGTLVSSSNNHAANAIGLVVFGTSIPAVSLDPLLGTSGCSLYVALDGSIALLTGPTAPANLQISFVVTAAMSGSRINVQHACLEPVPGGWSLSNAVAVQFP